MMRDQPISPQLVNALDEIAGQAGHLPLEQRLIDLTVWYFRNKPRLSKEAIGLRLDFAERTAEIMIELAALIVQRLQQAEGRPKSQNLWLPRGVEAKGSLRKFG